MHAMREKREHETREDGMKVEKIKAKRTQNNLKMRVSFTTRDTVHSLFIIHVSWNTGHDMFSSELYLFWIQENKKCNGGSSVTKLFFARRLTCSDFWADRQTSQFYIILETKQNDVVEILLHFWHEWCICSMKIAVICRPLHFQWRNEMS